MVYNFYGHWYKRVQGSTICLLYNLCRSSEVTQSFKNCSICKARCLWPLCAILHVHHTFLHHVCNTSKERQMAGSENLHQAFKLLQLCSLQYWTKLNRHQHPLCPLKETVFCLIFTMFSIPYLSFGDSACFYVGVVYDWDDFSSNWMLPSFLLDTPTLLNRWERHLPNTQDAV